MIFDWSTDSFTKDFSNHSSQPKMNYLPFFQDTQGILKEQFLSECPKSLKDIFDDKRFKNLMKLQFCKAQDKNIYLVIISCHIDRVLIELGQLCGFPRGFPCIWRPGKSLQTFGFYPKFDNDDRQEPDKMDEFENLSNVRFFEKWSGFLGQVIVFKYDDDLYWTVTSKNSGRADSDFVQDAFRIISPCMTPQVVAAMFDQNLHFCCEVMSQKDQTHGARVLQENFIITAIGVGCSYYFDDSQVNSVQDRFIKFMSHQEIITFCHQHSLPCGSAVIIDGQMNIKEFMTCLSTARDYMNLQALNSLLESVSGVQRIQGTVAHQAVLGNVLEGLVLHLTDTDGKSWVKKYKFPNYTIRTMLLRTQFKNFILSSEHLKKEAKNFIKFWCVSPSGKDHWYKFALMAFVMKNSFQNPTPEIGDHIVIGDSIENVPDDIETMFFISFYQNLKYL